MVSKALSLVFVLFSLSMTASAGNVCDDNGLCVSDPSLTSDPITTQPRPSSSKAKASSAPSAPIIQGLNGGSLVIDIDRNGNVMGHAAAAEAVTPEIPLVVPSAGSTVPNPYTAYSGIGPQCYTPGHENECVLAELCGGSNTNACTAANVKLKALREEAQRKADEAKAQQPQQQPQQQPPPGGGSPQGGQPKKDDGNKDKGKGDPQNGGAPSCGKGGGDEDDGKDSDGKDSGSKQDGQCDPKALQREYTEKCEKKQEEADKICDKPPQGDSATGLGGTSQTKSGKKASQINGSSAQNITDWANKCQPPAQSCVDRCGAILEKIESQDCQGKESALKKLKKETEESKTTCEGHISKVGQACQQAGANAQGMQDAAGQAGQSAASGIGEAMKSLAEAMKQAQQQQQQENKGIPQEVPSNALCSDFGYTRACRCNNSGSEAACGLKMPN